MIRCAGEERCTDSHSYENRHHVFHAFTDDEYKIPGNAVVCTCVKRRLYAQEETLHSLARKVSRCS